jgi:hypothetical protein
MKSAPGDHRHLDLRAFRNRLTPVTRGRQRDRLRYPSGV